MAALELLLPLLFFLLSVSHSAPVDFTASFPLTSHPLSLSSASSTRQRMLAATQSATPRKDSYAAKYTMALIVSIPVGTPAQEQKMVLDTGSQLSWIHCNDHSKSPQATVGDGSSSPTSIFNPTVSSSFSSLSCKTSLCKPRVPDFSIPTACDQKQLCSYSYFYADGTLAEGNLIAEKLPLSSSPVILGCSKGSIEENGLLGMNMGRLSVLSQSKITKFSYCVPARASRSASSGTGAFFLGENPNAIGLKYVPYMTFSSSQSQQMPNLDPLAYTVPMRGIRVGSATLNISLSAFRPNSGGSGQTFMDSGSELTYLVDEAYEKVRDAVVKLVGPMMKKEFSFAGAADICFDEKYAPMAGKSIGGVGLLFDNGVEIAIEQDSVLTDVGNGVKCLAIGRSSMLGSAGNIIGNVHQQNLWVEYDLIGRRIGFGKTDCTKSLSQR